MQEHGFEPLHGLVRGLIDDTRDLVREEFALARAEIRQELSSAQTVGITFGAAGVAAAVGVTLLCIAIGGAVADLFAWPAWAGYGLVAVILLVGAYVLFRRGRSKAATIHALPRTVASVKENLAWMQRKSNVR